jgi:hypothetical protein
MTSKALRNAAFAATDRSKGPRSLKQRQTHVTKPKVTLTPILLAYFSQSRDPIPAVQDEQY